MNGSRAGQGKPSGPTDRISSGMGEAYSDSDTGRALAVLRRHGWNATSFQILEPGFRYWFEADVCVAYIDTGSAWVAAGAPIGPPHLVPAAAQRFVVAAAGNGR